MNRYCVCWLIGSLLLFPASPPLGIAADKFKIRIFRNSATFSQITAVNRDGEVIGTREVVNGPTTEMVPFFNDGESEVKIPFLDGFTNLEVKALSDSGLVVGYCSRVLGHADGSIRAFAWNSRAKKIVALQPLDGDKSSVAQDVSADGKIVTGYSLGPNPPGLRPCVWNWDASSEKWSITELPAILRDNPFVQASQVLISPRGKKIAASITESKTEDLIYDSCLVVWEEIDGRWVRRKVSDEQPKLMDINDAGVMVGSVTTQNGIRAVRVDASGKIDLIEMLPGDASNMACAINHAGTIVGYSDDPMGKEGGPQAFVWQDGEVLPLAFPFEAVDSAALTINEKGVIGGFVLPNKGDEAATTGILLTPIPATN